MFRYVAAVRPTSPWTMSTPTLKTTAKSLALKRAIALIAKMKGTVANVQTKLKGQPPRTIGL